MSTIRTCSYCYRKSCWVLLFQCGDCRRSRYCSLVCQRDGWTQHRSVCQAIVARHKARKIARQSARRALIFLELRAILKIQKCVRGYLQRVKFQRVISNAAFITTTTERTSTLPPATEGETKDDSVERARQILCDAETEDEPREGETKSNSITLPPATEGERKDEAQKSVCSFTRLSNGDVTLFLTHGNVTYTGGWKKEKDGETEGQWEDGEQHGHGILTYPGGQYDGEWQNGEKHGNGSETIGSDETYVGEYKNGTFNGQGTYTYADRGTYVGEWKDGSKHGYGTWIFPDDRASWAGEWVNDKQNKKYKRNKKCHCGSGKKFKRCCMRHTALSVTPSYCGISVTPKIEEHAAQALLACENPEAALLCRT